MFGFVKQEHPLGWVSSRSETKWLKSWKQCGVSYLLRRKRAKVLNWAATVPELQRRLVKIVLL